MSEDLLRNAIAKHLNTHDKRWMFLLIFFPEDLPYINLEGAPKTTAWEIWKRFRDNSSLTELETAMVKTFGNLI